MPRLDRLATLYLTSPLVRLFGPEPGVRVPILMYHSISHNLFGMSHPYYHINTLPSVFSEQMRCLRNAGYRTTGLAEAWAGLSAGADLSKVVVLTFGNGYRDFYTDAMDVLTQCGFSATLFLVTSRIRQTSLRVAGADYLTWRDVRQLQHAGIQFGSHTVTHPVMSQLDDASARREIEDSWLRLRTETSAAIPAFCYPNGGVADISAREPAILRALGFDTALTATTGHASVSAWHSSPDSPFLVPRFGYNGNPALFKQIVTGILRARLAMRLDR